MIRYAIPKPEPLAVQMDQFLRAVRGEPHETVTLAEGLDGLGTGRVAHCVGVVRRGRPDRRSVRVDKVDEVDELSRRRHGLRTGQDRPSARLSEIAESGWSVYGVDIDGGVVDSVNAWAAAVPRGARPRRAAGTSRHRRLAAGDGRRAPTRSPSRRRSSSSCRCVVDAANRPDFGALDAATTAVGAALRAGTLVSFETTVPVGTTRRSARLRHWSRRSGLRCGVDLFVCYSPERVSSGSVFADLRRYPKLVGGLDAASAAAGRAFYESVLEFDVRPDLPRPNGVWDVGSAEAAELAKLAETTYRDVNIAFANELAVAADEIGVDVIDVIEACNSQPYSHIHQPGIAVGGHCIPVYPHLLMGSTSARRLASVAREINDDMPRVGIELTRAPLRDAGTGTTVAVLGAAYRGGVKEVFRSGVWSLVTLLEERGANVRVHDPLFERRGASLPAAGLPTGSASRATPS